MATIPLRIPERASNKPAAQNINEATYNAELAKRAQEMKDYDAGQ